MGRQAEVALNHRAQFLLLFRQFLPKRFDIRKVLQDSIFCDNRRVKISCRGNDNFVVKFGDFLQVHHFLENPVMVLGRFSYSI